MDGCVCVCVSVRVCVCGQMWCGCTRVPDCVCMWVCVWMDVDGWVCVCVGICGCGCVCTHVSNVLPFHVNMTEVHICFHSLKEQRMLASLWGDLCLASVQTPPTVPLFFLFWNLSKRARLSHPSALPKSLPSLCEKVTFSGRRPLNSLIFSSAVSISHLTCLFLTLKGSTFISTHYVCFLFICLQSTCLLHSSLPVLALLFPYCFFSSCLLNGPLHRSSWNAPPSLVFGVHTPSISSAPGLPSGA